IVSRRTSSPATNARSASSTAPAFATRGTRRATSRSAAAGATTSAGRSGARTGPGGRRPRLDARLDEQAVGEHGHDGALGLPHVLVVAGETAEDPAGEDLLERAVDDPRAEPRRQVLAEDLLRLAVLDDSLQRGEREPDLLDLPVEQVAAPRDLAHEHSHDIGKVAPRSQDERAGLAELLARRFLHLDDPLDHADHPSPHLAEHGLEHR